MSATSFVRVRVLDHSRVTKLDALEMIVNYLGVEPEDALNEIEDIIRCHSRFGLLENLYAHY